jgi:hypothetical protein
MRTLIRLSFITTFLVLTVLSAQAALDPALMLYFTFDEQLDGKVVEDMTGGGHNGKLKFGAKITNEPAEVYKGAGALKIFNNISAQFRVDSFKRMDTYRDNTYTFRLYIFGPTQKPWGNGLVKIPHRASLLEKGRDLNLVGAFKGHAPAMFIREEPLALIYFYEGGEGNQGVLGPDSVGPGGKGTGFEPKTWYHIAGVKQGSDLTIYIDGKEIGIYAVPIAFVQGEGHLRVGATDIRASSFAMDEFQLFDRPLTKEEVALDVKGILHSVEPQDKLATSWGRIKTGR